MKWFYINKQVVKSMEISFFIVRFHWSMKLLVIVSSFPQTILIQILWVFVLLKYKTDRKRTRSTQILPLVQKCYFCPIHIISRNTSLRTHDKENMMILKCRFFSYKYTISKAVVLYNLSVSLLKYMNKVGNQMIHAINNFIITFILCWINSKAVLKYEHVSL